MSVGELSLVFTTLGLSPIGLARVLGERPKVILSWLKGSPVPFTAAIFMRLMVLHPEILDWRKEVAYYHF
jgi:hypothetical protein